jgi:hypothetical protein
MKILAATLSVSAPLARMNRRITRAKARTISGITPK